MEKVYKGWVIVDPAGEIVTTCALTKRAILDSPVKSIKQVWEFKSGSWSGELRLPRIFRDVWRKKYRRGFRFVRCQVTITTEA